MAIPAIGQQSLAGASSEIPLTAWREQRVRRRHAAEALQEAAAIRATTEERVAHD
jgi:hypothetical protein